MAMTIVDLLEVIDIEHEHRHPHAARPVTAGKDADLAEKIGTMVEPGERVAYGPLEHFALKSLIVRIEPYQLENHAGSELNPVAVPETHRPVRGYRFSVDERAVRAAQVGDLDITLAGQSDLSMPPRNGDVIDLKVAFRRAAEGRAALAQLDHRSRHAAVYHDHVSR